MQLCTFQARSSYFTGRPTDRVLVTLKVARQANHLSKRRILAWCHTLQTSVRNLSFPSNWSKLNGQKDQRQEIWNDWNEITLGCCNKQRSALFGAFYAGFLWLEQTRHEHNFSQQLLCLWHLNRSSEIHKAKNSNRPLTLP